MYTVLRFFLASALVAGSLSGCTHLPVSGPSHRAIEGEASELLVKGRRDVALDYVLIDIDRNVLEHSLAAGPESLFATFGLGRSKLAVPRLSPGDVILISLFESPAGNLFASGEPAERGLRRLVLPQQAIDHDGLIAIPYAGQIRAAGRTVAEVRQDIEALLSKRGAIEPQVVVSLVEQNSNDVAVFGDAAGNIRHKLRGGERLLDVIAIAGLKSPGYETFVTLQRKDKRATIYLPKLVEKRDENVYLERGDVVYIYKQPQTYLAIGALGSATQTQGLTGRFSFDSPRLSLAEAIAKAGGLLDTRADARQVLLYRLEYRDVLERLGLQLKHFPAHQKLIPTIYRANYRDPSMLFAADHFHIRHHDIIYVANADAVEVEKLLSYVRLYTSSVAGVATDMRATRDAFVLGSASR